MRLQEILVFLITAVSVLFVGCSQLTSVQSTVNDQESVSTDTSEAFHDYAFDTLTYAGSCWVVSTVKIIAKVKLLHSTVANERNFEMEIDSRLQYSDDSSTVFISDSTKTFLKYNRGLRIYFQKQQ